MIFSYDPKQYLKKGEDKNIHTYLLDKYPNETDKLRKLTTRIRTNKKISSFINNMLEIGSSKDNLDYENITIEYFNNPKNAKEYMEYLDTKREWTAITFTPSQHSIEPINSLSCLCNLKAHGVIGQEFDKVVFAMDSNFQYSENNKLAVMKNYYSPKGMLYQIMTRAVTELKIIVINNPGLYEKLMYIKNMGDTIESDELSSNLDPIECTMNLN